MEEETGDGDGFKVPKAVQGEEPSPAKKAKDGQGICHIDTLCKV